MTTSDFVHLHVHTTHSFLDGMCAPRALAARAAALGQPAVAVTDHGHLGAALATYRAARDAGIRGIIGMEAYTAQFGHLILLARDVDGYRNLRELATRQQHAQLDIDDLITHIDGLVVTTACVANRIAGHAARGDMTKARAAATALASAVGATRLFLELQPTAGPHLRANTRLQELAQDMGLRCVVTNDVHYLDPGQHHAQNVLMAIRQGKRLRDAGLHQHPAPVYYLRSGEEMTAACAEAGIDTRWLATTAEVAHGCRLDLDLGVPDLPPFSDNDDETLLNTAVGGLRAREHQTSKPMLGTRYEDQLRFELSVIADMGYSGYFLIVQDFVGWAREHGCAVGPGRGSGAGSMVAYALGITDLDPIEHKLFFERFLNPERVSMPDFDIDFMQARRGDVIDYVVGRWGRERVGQIATYMALHPKSAIKDAARVMGIAYAEVNALTRGIPAIVKPRNDEEAAMDEFSLAMVHAPELMALAGTDPVYGQLLATARALTGCVRQTGKHAGGVVIGRRPLVDYTPLTDDGRTQYDMNDVESAGLVKFDFLGLKTLDVIAGACELAGGVDVRALPLDDEAVYSAIAAGDTWGLFQVESPGMTRLCRDLVPDRFDDIVAAVALYRPGPMESGMLDAFIARKHGRQDVEYPHPDLETVLADTYGTIVYQEQVMQAAQVLAGYTLGGADLLRRAMGKKKPAEMAKQRAIWLAGCADNGIDGELATEIFDAIEKFAGYGFNRAHAAAYAMITYQTAWLKTHHRLPFAAALLSVEAGDADKLAHYVRQIRASGIVVLPPDVNASGAEFRVEGPCLRWGLGAIKGLGMALLEPLLAGAPYADVYDLAERSRLPKSALAVLVSAGACDGLHPDGHRAAMLAALEAGTARGKAAAAADVTGQVSMLNLINLDATPLPDVPRSGDELVTEHRLLGSYVSGHPMTGVGAITPSTWSAWDPWVSGVVVDVFARTSKKSGKLWAKVTIEDEGGHMTLLVFPDAYAAAEELLRIGATLTFTGHANTNGEFVVDEARVFDAEEDNGDDY